MKNIVGITFNWRSGKWQDISSMLSYIERNADKLGIIFEELTVFSLCRAVNNTINCVLNYPQIKKTIIYYGKVSTNTNVKRCKGMHFFIALGNNDVKYPPKCNQWFIEKSKENGYQTEIMIHPHGEHGFDYANHDKYTKEIIQRTVSFIKQ